LPALRKTILYLDQNAVNEMMKAINPATRSHRRPVLDRWRELFRRIDRLVKLQLLVCPGSPTRDHESAVSPFHDALARMSSLLSGGARFHSSVDVRLLQLDRCVRRSFGDPIDATGTAEEVVLGSLHGWTPKLQLSVEFPFSVSDLRRLRATRDRTQALLHELNESRWLQERLSFDEWVLEESREFGRLLKFYYEQFLERASDVFSGRRPISELNLGDIAHRTIESVRHAIMSLGIGRDNAQERALAFIASDDVNNVPSIRINSMLYAARARKAASGQLRPPRASFVNDVQAISSYLPYCDAMFVDNECRALLVEEPVRSRLGYSTRVFSVSIWSAFTQYLDSLLGTCTDERRALVRTVYGDSWEEPFESMYATTSA